MGRTSGLPTAPRQRGDPGTGATAHSRYLATDFVTTCWPHFHVLATSCDGHLPPPWPEPSGPQLRLLPERIFTPVLRRAHVANEEAPNGGKGLEGLRKTFLPAEFEHPMQVLNE